MARASGRKRKREPVAPFNFLGLPRELRDKVYEEYMTSHFDENKFLRLHPGVQSHPVDKLLGPGQLVEAGRRADSWRHKRSCRRRPPPSDSVWPSLVFANEQIRGELIHLLLRKARTMIRGPDVAGAAGKFIGYLAGLGASGSTNAVRNLDIYGDRWWQEGEGNEKTSSTAMTENPCITLMDKCRSGIVALKLDVRLRALNVAGAVSTIIAAMPVFPRLKTLTITTWSLALPTQQNLLDSVTTWITQLVSLCRGIKSKHTAHGLNPQIVFDWDVWAYYWRLEHRAFWLAYTAMMEGAGIDMPQWSRWITYLGRVDISNVDD